MDSGEVSADTIAAVMRRLTKWLMIEIAKEMQIDNGSRVGGMGGMGRACTSALLLMMMTVCQMYKGTREGSHMVDIQQANYQTDEGHDASQRSFSSGQKSFGPAARPVVHVSASLPREHS
jgi:hypothetical protein